MQALPGRNSRSEDEIDSGSNARSQTQKHEEMVTDFGELLHCVSALKEAHVTENANLKQKHKTMKEEIRGLKEARLREMEASIMKNTQFVHTILICIMFVMAAAPV
ncbi:hypothetical protein ACLOJK_020043 [Asimina triloba]